MVPWAGRGGQGVPVGGRVAGPGVKHHRAGGRRGRRGGQGPGVHGGKHLLALYIDRLFVDLCHF